MMLEAAQRRMSSGREPQKGKSKGSLPLRSNRHLTAPLFEEQGTRGTDELIIRREIPQNGRSVSRINGQMVNLSVLKAVGQHLVDIHGQHDQEEPMRPQLHIAMLDEFGMQPFSKPKTLIVKPLKIEQTSAQTSSGTPAQPAGKQGPYWDVGVSNRRDWGSCLEVGWGTCVWSKNANACSIIRWLQIP